MGSRKDTRQVSERQCTNCKEAKPLKEFYQTKHGRFGRNSVCRICVMSMRKHYLKTNPEAWKKNQIARRRCLLKKRYGITEDDYEALLDRQGRRCAICGTAKPGGRNNRFHVDHDHELEAAQGKPHGTIRGAICSSCNGALACAGDNLAGVMKFVEYLLRTDPDTDTHVATTG